MSFARTILRLYSQGLLTEDIAAVVLSAWQSDGQPDSQPVAADMPQPQAEAQEELVLPSQVFNGYRVSAANGEPLSEGCAEDLALVCETAMERAAAPTAMIVGAADYQVAVLWGTMLRQRQGQVYVQQQQQVGAPDSLQTLAHEAGDLLNETIKLFIADLVQPRFGQAGANILYFDYDCALAANMTYKDVLRPWVEHCRGGLLCGNGAQHADVHDALIELHSEFQVSPVPQPSGVWYMEVPQVPASSQTPGAEQ